MVIESGSQRLNGWTWFLFSRFKNIWNLKHLLFNILFVVAPFSRPFEKGSLWWTLQHDITRILGIGASQSLHTLWEQPALSYSDQTGSIKPLFFFNIVSSNTLNHNPTCGFIVIFLIRFPTTGDCWMYDLFQKVPNISTVVLSPVSPWPTPRAERGFRNAAMDEAQAVLKATDDEAKRICQEIRRIGGTDRALELFLRDGPWMMNIVMGRYTPRHLTRGFVH